MDINYSNQNLYFKNRCPQIRDSQWVIHKIKTRFPHTSPSLFRPAYTKSLENRPELPTGKISKQIIKNFLFDRQKYIDKLKYFKNFINKIDNVRLEYYDNIRNIKIFEILNMLQNTQIGNCMENAKVAELILKMNGIKNSCCAVLTSGEHLVDHLVCVFNKDGSKFDGKVKNSTIIIDPWAQKTDFATNMLIYYKNMMHKHLCYLDFNGEITIDPNTKLGLLYQNELKLKPNQLKALKEKYPELIYKSKIRKFMNRKSSK